MIWYTRNSLASRSLRGILLSLFLITPTAQASLWICGNGNWNWNGLPNASCWDWWDYPDAGEDVWIVDTVYANAKNVTYVNPGYNPTLKGLYINSNSGTASAVYQSQDRLTVTDEQIGTDGEGYFQQDGGKHTVSNNLYLGYQSGSFGDYSLKGDGELYTANTYVGNAQHGVFTQSENSDHEVANGLYLGHATGSYGQYFLNDGYLTSQNTYIGYDGAGTLSLASNHISRHVVTDSLYLGYGSNGRGVYVIATENADAVGVLTVTNDAYLGYEGSGEVRQYGGAVNISDTVYLGSALESFGQYRIQNASLTAASLHVGSTSGGRGVFRLHGSGSLSVVDEIIHGSGAFEQFAGTHSISGGLVIHGGGLFQDNEGVFHRGGAYWLAGGVLNAANVVIFRTSHTTFNAELFQDGGENNVSGNLYLGQFPTTGGVGGLYELVSGSLVVEGYAYIGNSGTGFFSQVGGSNTLTSLYLGNNASGEGDYHLNGGFLYPTEEIIGNSGSGEFLQSGGTHSVHTKLRVGAFDGTGSFDMQNGILEVGQELIVGSLGSMKIGGGTVSADTVNLTEAKAFDFVGGKLAASTIQGNLVNTGGTLATGFSPGILTIEGDYTQLTGGSLKIELGGTSRGTEYDAVNVTGALGLGGTLQVTWWDDFYAGMGDSFDILDWQSVLGTFDTLNLPALPRGLGWDTSNLYIDGTLVVGEEQPLFADGFE